MSVLVCTLIIMSTGYAILTQVIKVDGTVTVERDWDVKITGITDGTPVGAAENEVAPSYDATTASFSTLLYNKGDSMTYSVTVENFGSWDAKLETITLTDSNNPAVKFTVSGVNEGDALPSGSTHVLTVKVEYNSAFTGELTNNIGTLTVSLTYVQDDSSTVVPTPPTPSENSVIYSRNLLTYSSTNFSDETWKQENFIWQGDNISKITGYTEDYNTLNNSFFLKHKRVDNQVESNELCFIKDGLYCLKPNEYETSKATLTSVFGESTCSLYGDALYCPEGTFEVSINNAGYITVYNTSGTEGCEVHEDGSAECYLNNGPDEGGA